MFVRDLDNFRSEDFASSMGLFNSPPPPHQLHRFLVFRQSFMCLNMCPLSLALSLDTMDKSLVQSSSFPSIRFINIDEIVPEPSILQSKLSSVSPLGPGDSSPSIMYVAPIFPKSPRFPGYPWWEEICIASHCIRNVLFCLSINREEVRESRCKSR